jgi:hypothetical protein
MPDLRDDLAAYLTELADRAERSVAGRAKPTAGRASRPRAVWPRVAAAAAVVMVAAVTFIVAAREGDEPTVVSGPAAMRVDGEAFAVPGTAGFDPATAPPVWPVIGEDALAGLLNRGGAAAAELVNPTDAAAAYLDDVAAPRAITLADVTPAPDRRTATARWELPACDQPCEKPGLEPLYEGSIYLRQVGHIARPIWVVVGASTDVGTLSEVRSDGDRVGFTITPSASNSRGEGGDSLAIRVRVDGTFVSMTGRRLPQGGPPDPASGELVSREADADLDLQVDVEPSDQIEILVRHVGGTWLSLTHMALQVPRAGEPHGPT